MMRLQMPKGCDEIGHGPNKYTVSNVDWCVSVPDHVGVTLLATGSEPSVSTTTASRKISSP
jgi:hypothetical protein